ncbi:MAG: hypothetical protein A2451_09770 [Bdellovibrionales bacterium RIFOXYC2_FULL_39_8]|nr:MAG: hypothetical protein A2385_01905 [Bdellovibrionales bacterium RIFOXYB1_FULL_39_21]OFZ47591.1 MAG: hypothetical protein A2404_14075 [Bdellovibrionales bacterium RIFOXYC1_FULL_39_130]OFZ72032.1 MAG: hypothetical protein A2451_09770 [Bdellovibrionales bacterium RIFOXYC2_FULL_39_8]OFZ76117.1 MAG: hypothetical protein A2560_16665 [Bdellovibrionales bacterium RIFOXYD1_FULL_39_84]
MIIKILLLLGVLLTTSCDSRLPGKKATSVSTAGRRVLSYGFEDFVGYDGNNSPAPKYIFSIPDVGTWANHVASTRVISSCGGKSAYSGNYFFHVQTNQTHLDSCLEGTATTTNAYSVIGTDYTLPFGEKESTTLNTVITENGVFLRFRLRTTDDWSAINVDTEHGHSVDYGEGMKFIRWAIGSQSYSDSNTVLIRALNDGDSATPSFGIYDNGNPGSTFYQPTINWQDGNWHSFGLKITRQSVGVYHISIFLDDWEAANTPLGEKTVTMPTPGDGNYYGVILVANWSAQYPSELMGFDFDDIEIFGYEQ